MYCEQRTKQEEQFLAHLANINFHVMWCNEVFFHVFFSPLYFVIDMVRFFGKGYCTICLRWMKMIWKRAREDHLHHVASIPVHERRSRKREKVKIRYRRQRRWERESQVQLRNKERAFTLIHIHFHHQLYVYMKMVNVFWALDFSHFLSLSLSSFNVLTILEYLLLRKLTITMVTLICYWKTHTHAVVSAKWLLQQLTSEK